jgi:hypothetical protein
MAKKNVVVPVASPKKLVYVGKLKNKKVYYQIEIRFSDVKLAKFS